MKLQNLAFVGFIPFSTAFQQGNYSPHQNSMNSKTFYPINHISIGTMQDLPLISNERSNSFSKMTEFDFNIDQTSTNKQIDLGTKENSAEIKSKLNMNDNCSQKRKCQRPEFKVEAIPGIDSTKLKSAMYSILGKLKTHPRAALHTLMTGEVPKYHLDRFDNTRKAKGKTMKDTTQPPIASIGPGSNDMSNVNDTESPSNLYHDSRSIGTMPSPETPFEGQRHMSHLRRRRDKKDRPGVMYLPINQPHADPCAPAKGSKLMQALPLVFLSTILSVSDAVGNVINNINNNNNNNNNNNDNNINNDNTNLAANINNANQINLTPTGGRALRLARAIMTSIGNMALGVYDTIMPLVTRQSDNVDDKHEQQNLNTTKIDFNELNDDEENYKQIPSLK